MAIRNHFYLLIIPPLIASDVMKPGVTIDKGNLVLQFDKKPKGTIIFLHGHGSTGTDFRFWVAITNGGDIHFPHLRAIFPTGIVKPHVPGSLRRVTAKQEQYGWLYKKELEHDIDSVEESESLQASIEGISKIIRDEVANGIPLKKMIIGGYTMGGTVALHVALRIFPQMAGVFGLSTFLPRESIVYEEMKKQNRTTWPKVYFSQGAEDPNMSLPIANWTRETLDKLKKFGVKGEFKIVGEGGHSFTKLQLIRLWDWVWKVLPL